MPVPGPLLPSVTQGSHPQGFSFSNDRIIGECSDSRYHVHWSFECSLHVPENSCYVTVKLSDNYVLLQVPKTFICSPFPYFRIFVPRGYIFLFIVCSPHPHPHLCPFSYGFLSPKTFLVLFFFTKLRFIEKSDAS